MVVLDFGSVGLSEYPSPFQVYAALLVHGTWYQEALTQRYPLYGGQCTVISSCSAM